MWQERLFPELTMLGTEEERREVLAAAERRTLGWGKRIGTVIAIGVVGGAVIGGGLALLSRRMPIPSWVSGAVTGMITGATAAIAVQVLWRRPLQREIRRELNERGVPVCLRCGYNLTGLTERRCPECGSPFEQSHRPA